MPPRIPAIAPSKILLNISKRPQCIHRAGETASRQFSSSSQLQKARWKQPTRLRQLMYTWYASIGAKLENPIPGATNYLGAYTVSGQLKRVVRRALSDKEQGIEDSPYNDLNPPPDGPQDWVPFTRNQEFRSEPVTSEELRELVWSKVMRDGQSVATVSAELGVEMHRVGAIVRLKEIEKEWIRKRKPLATPYSRAVLDMLPKPPKDFRDSDGKKFMPFESINDLPAHAATMQQIFLPTSESRHFTRVDAAAIFEEGLKPADDRVPHPELIQLEKERLSGMSYEDRIAVSQQRSDNQQKAKFEKEERRRKAEAATTKIVDTGRWEFRFKDISVEAAGKDGRGPQGVGARYGVPHQDRKRGQVKIPVRVES